MAKKIIFDTDAREALLKGVNEALVLMFFYFLNNRLSGKAEGC